MTKGDCMQKVRVILAACALIAVFALSGCGMGIGAGQETNEAQSDVTVIDVEAMGLMTMSEARAMIERFTIGRYRLLEVSGNVFGFGPCIPENRWYGFQEKMPNVQYWVTGINFMRGLNLRTDSQGFWHFYVLKRVNCDFAFSMSFENDFWPAAVEQAVFGQALARPAIRIQSCDYVLKDADLPLLGQQMPDEIFYNVAKGQIESNVSKAIGIPYTVTDMTIMTVCKSWASMYDSRVPHGDAGAQLAPREPLAFPSLAIYFNDSIQPDPAQNATSFDGDIAVLNRGPGKFAYSATKEGVSYSTVSFTMADDSSVDAYVASPPNSVMGSNSSEPGQH